MAFTVVDQAAEAVERLEKANADLEPELLDAATARSLLEIYARANRLSAFGLAALSRKLEDASDLARVTGTSIDKAKATVATGKALSSAENLSDALQHGAISLDQAVEIAKAEESRPGAATELVGIARDHAFHVLKDKARKIKLEAEQHRGLAERQRAARNARSYSDELGMVHVHLALEPHVGTPIVARAEAEAARFARAARRSSGLDRTRGNASHDSDSQEPFERYLADAYAALLSGSGKGRATRPELVILVSHEVAKRGWTDVREGELCKIPGAGPVSPQVAREIAQDAFLTGVFYDGIDLRQFKRWSRTIPVEVAIALELGAPPSFDGVSCVDCGNRFRTEFDHVQPRVAGGPSSNPNISPRCWSCHRKRTERDRRAAKLKPPDP